MFKRIAVCAILALGVASAESYKVNLFQPSKLQGTELKPGEYRFNVENGKATIVKGKQTVEAPVKVETADRKFSSTSIRYTADGVISEVRLGGTTTKLVFSN